jgi:CHAT domain-containing protein
LQAILWEHRDKIKRIRVVSSEPFIPWELVHLKEPGESLPDETSNTKFLGQMGLIRWLHEAGRAPEQVKMRNGRARYVIPEYPDEDIRLPEAEQERAFLEKTFSATAVEPNQDAVYKILSKPGEFDLLHFACHGSAENDNISDASIMLQGRMETVQDNGEVKEIYIEDILEATFAEQSSRLKAKDNRPMVVLNACQTGREGYSLTGIGGFAQAFLKRGAGVFVGTLWAVGDSPARTFTETLYRQLYEKGLNLADAVIIARESARKAGDATWLAYAVYGHPNMKFSK